ncbi:MAG: aspartate aminotransferase family protein [Phycisphaerales bacterium]|nr:aspartate aminotransferase family protein [Phycisphaerales bacterium]
MDVLASREISGLYRRLNTAAVAAPFVMRGGEGCWIESIEGERFLDLTAGYGVASTGWNHPRIVACVREQASRSLFAPPMLVTREAAELSHALLEVMAAPEEWRCVRATGGADANEQVLKAVVTLAERARVPRPHRVLRYERAYHGGTSAMLALSDIERHGLARPLSQAEHPCLPVPTSAEDIRLVTDLLECDRSVCAVMVEPVIGSGGVHPFPIPYLRSLRELCSARGVPLIFDEVMTGCGRVGAMLAAHLAGIMPDAITLGKGLSSGAAAVGAALVNPQLAGVICAAEDTTSTFAWSPLGCAVASETLRIIEEENLQARAAVLGPRLRDGIAALFQGVFGDRAVVRGVGMMVGADVLREAEGEPDAAIIRCALVRCRRAGVLVGASWDWKTMVLLPPLVMTEREVEEAIVRLGHALEGLRPR